MGRAGPARGAGRSLLARRHPDRRFLPPTAGDRLAGAERTFGSRDLALAGEPDAGALLLEPAGPGARGEVVALLHGGGNDRLYGLWYAIDRLLAAGYTVATCHLPGHGAGGRDAFTVAATRRRLAQLLATLRRETRPARLAVLGQSLGGSFALDLLALGEPVDAVVGVSVPWRLRLGPGAALELLGLLRPLAWRALDHGGLAEVLPALGPFGRRRLPVRLPAGGSYVRAFARALDTLDLPARAPAGAAALPCLLVHGRRDRLVPPAQARVLAERWRATLLVRDRPGHFDILFDPATLDAILGWLARLPGNP